MRKFGNDKPEFMEFKLGDSDEVYKLPLASSLPMQTLIDMNDAAKAGEAAALRFQMDLLRRYIGDVADTLTAGQVGEIYAAWNEESTDSGASAGE